MYDLSIVSSSLLLKCEFCLSQHVENITQHARFALKCIQIHVIKDKKTLFVCGLRFKLQIPTDVVHSDVIMSSLPEATRSLMRVFGGKLLEFTNEIDNVHMVWLGEIQQEAYRMFSR